ncbi:MAG: aminopeptidase P N-terminal domain-containing protein [Vicinamibacterales bacterium]
MSRFLLAMAILLAARPARAQHYQSDFPADEFKARWTKLYDRIGDGAVAVVQGMPLTDGYTFPRQYNTFYYLSGIETPGAYMLFDGRTRKATPYLPPRNERLERAEGKVLSADDAELVKRLTGVDDVLALEAMRTEGWPLNARTIFAEFRPAEAAGQSRGELVSAETARALDYWDGGTSRQRRFVELLRARHPRAEIRDLNPILDELRAIKSPREDSFLLTPTGLERLSAPVPRTIEEIESYLRRHSPRISPMSRISRA